MKIEKIAVLTGGDSSEREVSLQTAEAVSASLTRMKINHDVSELTCYKDLLDFSFKGYTRTFLALHGGFGENGMAQAYLEGMKIPHNGPSPQASALCMDKRLTKYIAKGLGLKTPEHLFFSHARDASFELANKRFGDRFIIKPNGQGCSIGVSLIHANKGEFENAIETLLPFNESILIEEFIPGQELSVCYFYGHILPIFALGFTTNFFSYEAKFLSEDTKCWLADLNKETNYSIQRDCTAMAQALGLDYFRADIILNNGRTHLIELNTLPGLTTHSLFPRACLEHGVPFDEMVLILNNLKTARDVVN